MFRIATVGLAMLVKMSAAYAAQAPQQFLCSGSMHQPTDLALSRKSGRLIIGPANEISLDLGQGDVKAGLVSDNKIQLKFSTKDFTGEFFHCTGDLFLIYKSGHFAKLACTPTTT
jgi:hypothetical protein